MSCSTIQFHLHLELRKGPRLDNVLGKVSTRMLLGKPQASQRNPALSEVSCFQFSKSQGPEDKARKA